MGTRVDLSLVFAVALLALFWYVMRYTRWGLEMRAIGGNPQAALRNGIPLKAYLVGIMCLGGAIAGLAGMALVSGYYGLLLVNFSSGSGYMGFLISWLAFGDPLGILLVCLPGSPDHHRRQSPAADPRAAVCRDQHPAGPGAIYRACAKPTFIEDAESHQVGESMTLLAILGVISSAIYSGTSLLYATLGEVVGERAGIVNLGLEGVLLVSASVGVAVASRDAQSVR